MAYGMLTSFALGAAEGLGNAVVNKVGRMQEEELKANIEAEREQRIEEAAKRAEERKQAWETNPDNPNYQAAMSKLDSAELEKQLAKQKLAAGEFEASTRAQTYASKQREDELKAKQMEASTSKTLSDISINQAEADQKQKVYRAGDDLVTAIKSGDQQAIDQATKNYKAIAGKDIEKSQLKAVDIPTGETDKQGKPVVITKLFRVYGDNSAEEIKTTSANIPKTPEQINEQAIAIANSLSDGKVYFNSLDEAQKYKGEDWYKPMTKDEKTNRETWLSNYGKAMADPSYEGGKAPSGKGMLNRGGTDQTEKTDVTAGKVSKTEPLIKIDDPTKQAQYDTLNSVILYSESGTAGPNAGSPKPTKDNPHPTAAGSYQITDIAMKDLGVKPDLPNGKYSVDSKEKAAPDYYVKAYNDTQGDASAYLAYRFAPSDVKQAVETAKEKGGNWWDYAKSDYTKENMATVVRDAKRTMLQLGRENKPIPLEIQRIILAHR